MKLTEGGNAIKDSSRIPYENVQPTIDAFIAEVMSKLDYNDVGPIGSTGKKKSEGNGDIDLSLDAPKYDLASLSDELKKIGVEHKVSHGFGEINCKFPQYDKDGNQTELFAQVDLMLGDASWNKFIYYTAGEGETSYKAMHRVATLHGIFGVACAETDEEGYITYWTYAASRGAFRKKGKKIVNKKGVEEFKSERVDAGYINDPEKIAEVVSSYSSEPWSVEDFMTSVEDLWSKIRKSFDSEKVEKMLTRANEFLVQFSLKPISESTHLIQSFLNEYTYKISNTASLEQDLDIYPGNNNKITEVLSDLSEYISSNSVELCDLIEVERAIDKLNLK